MSALTVLLTLLVTAVLVAVAYVAIEEPEGRRAEPASSSRGSTPVRW